VTDGRITPFLARHGHEVVNPKLPGDNSPRRSGSPRPTSTSSDRVVVGSSRAILVLSRFGNTHERYTVQANE
jgi:hypothetical protein